MEHAHLLYTLRKSIHDLSDFFPSHTPLAGREDESHSIGSRLNGKQRILQVRIRTNLDPHS
jgi:hypothetical protein